MNLLQPGPGQAARLPFFSQRYPLRLLQLMVGLMLFGLGNAMNVQAALGLAPWNVFSQGFSLHTPFTIGQITQLAGLVIVIADLILREPLGFGSILNIFLVGFWIDFFIDWIAQPAHFVPRWALLVGGLFVTALGACLYMGARLGAGPRDSLMVGLSKRMTKVPVGTIRNGIDLFALVVGWALGGMVGVGTVVAAFGYGYCLQIVFKLLHFDARKLRSESILDTLRILSGKQAPDQPPEETAPEQAE